MKQLKGVDISHHQNVAGVRNIVNKKTADFIILRGSIGTSKEDSSLASFIHIIESTNIPIGYYVASYSKNVNEARAEADYLCNIIEKYHIKPDVGVFFDWEYFSADYIKKQFGIIADKRLIQDMTTAFCEQVKARGHKTGVYYNKDFNNRFYGSKYWEEHPDYLKWYARPSLSKPDDKCNIWQYASNNGAEFYYSGNIDKNIMYAEEPVEKPMKPLSAQPIKMKIGFASAGDIKKLTVKLDGLKIPYKVENGYIYTELMSAGDQCYIMLDCDNLGIKYEIYKEDNCEEIKAENEKMKNEIQELKDEITKLHGALYSIRETINTFIK